MNMKMKIQFIDITEELKRARSSQKMKLIVGVVFEYNDDKKFETEVFIHNINEKNYPRNRF